MLITKTVTSEKPLSQIDTHTHTHTHTHRQTHTDTHTYTFTHTYTHKHTSRRKGTKVMTNTHLHTHKRAHTYTHTAYLMLCLLLVRDTFRSKKNINEFVIIYKEKPLKNCLQKLENAAQRYTTLLFHLRQIF